MDNTKIAASRVSLLSEQMSDFVGSTVGGGKSYSKKAGFVDILVQVLAFVISASAFGLKGCDKDSARCFCVQRKNTGFLPQGVDGNDVQVVCSNWGFI